MRHAVAIATILATATIAHAEPGPLSYDGDVMLVAPPSHPAAAAHTIYLNRCAGGCTVRPGDNDATTDHSSLISQTSSLTPFKYSDATWNAVVDCVKEVYAPYDVQIVETEPAASEDYIEAMVAGTPDEIGQSNTTLGYSPMAADCSPQVRWISFVLANIHQDNALNICATVAHETGHVYGLDHTYDCKDPMTYLTGCGQKFFLDLPMDCGEFDGPRPCKCDRTTENTHVLLTNEIGVGTLPAPPEVSVLYPADGATVADGFSMFGKVVEPRIVSRVEFWLNGFPYSRQVGSRDTDTYTFAAPSDLPDGVIDLEVRAYDDLLQVGSSAVTIIKGAACTSASTCADGQDCNDGRCEFPPPTLAVGDTCATSAECESFQCVSDGSNSLCTEPCVVGVEGSCGDGFTCIQDGDYGACWPSDLLDHPGCCDTGGAPGGPIALGLGVALLVLRRRPTARR